MLGLLQLRRGEYVVNDGPGSIRYLELLGILEVSQTLYDLYHKVPVWGVLYTIDDILTEADWNIYG